MKNEKVSIFWFRQDLRLSDNPALTHAVSQGKVLPVYIFDDTNPDVHIMGSAMKWWTHHSLSSLHKSFGGRLNFYKGDPEKIFDDLLCRYQVTGVYWNRCYEPWRMQSDARVKEQIKKSGVDAASFNGSLLWEPWEVLKDDGTPYKVFTHFFRKRCLMAQPPRQPIKAVTGFKAVKDNKAVILDSLGLLPRFRWDKQFEPYWDVSEAGAQNQLSEFLKNGLARYKEGRNFPERKHISRLSPYLHSGEISPNQVWHAAKMREYSTDIDHFCSELGWREFCYSLLYNFPSLPYENLQKKFDVFPWKNNSKALQLWQRGLTGYPIVDAGMRELWRTGYMHNRVRMIVASFLVKNLMIDWRFGASWFWDCLIDANLANNSANWQWVAGCGADAAPYFRVFNPISQGKKFDPDGLYTRKYLPELGKLPDRYLFEPWKAPEDVLRRANISLGETYPKPIVDFRLSRERALEAFYNLAKR